MKDRIYRRDACFWKELHSRGIFFISLLRVNEEIVKNDFTVTTANR